MLQLPLFALEATSSCAGLQPGESSLNPKPTPRVASCPCTIREWHPLFSSCSIPNPSQRKPETSFTLSLECCLGSLWSDRKAAELFLAAPHQFCVPERVGSSTWGDSAYKYWRGFTFRDDILITSAKSYGPTCQRLMKELLWLVESSLPRYPFPPVLCKMKCNWSCCHFKREILLELRQGYQNKINGSWCFFIYLYVGSGVIM